MKTFNVMRVYRPTCVHRAVTIAELSYMDILRLLCGREIEIDLPSDAALVLRNATAYEALNLEATPAVEIARPAPDPRD